MMSGFILLGIVSVILLCLLSSFLGSVRFRKIPFRTSYVKVIMRYAVMKSKRWWRSSPPGKKTYLVLLQMKDGAMREFQIGETEYNVLQEGMTGLLVWQGSRYISFEEF